MPRYAVPISIPDLKIKILTALNKYLEEEGEDLISMEELEKDSSCQMHHIIDMTKEVQTDLAKCAFDTENIFIADTDGVGDLLGFKTLDNGFTFLACLAGGDWEQPVYFIIYWSGTCLRAYIPSKGNLWNRTTKQAYGNDSEKDYADALKQGYIEKGDETDPEDFVIEDCVEPDIPKMIEDIKERILIRIIKSDDGLKKETYL